MTDLLADTEQAWLRSIDDAMRRMEMQDAEILALRQQVAAAAASVEVENVRRLEAENAKLNEQLIALHAEYSAALQVIAVLSAALRATYQRALVLAAMLRAAQVG